VVAGGASHSGGEQRGLGHDRPAIVVAARRRELLPQLLLLFPGRAVLRAVWCGGSRRPADAGAPARTAHALRILSRLLAGVPLLLCRQLQLRRRRALLVDDVRADRHPGGGRSVASGGPCSVVDERNLDRRNGVRGTRGDPAGAVPLVSATGS